MPKWITMTERMPPQDEVVLMRRTGSEQIPRWEWLCYDHEERIQKALEIAVTWGTAEGEQQKAWVIDQIVKALAGEEYQKVVDHIQSQDGEWPVGIAP